MDVICLQEVFNIQIVDYLKTYLNKKYNFYYNERKLIQHYLFLFVFLFITYYFIDNYLLIFCYFLFINLIFKNSTIYSFIFSEINSGLVTLVNKKYEKVNWKHSFFKEQGNDLLNNFNKKGYHLFDINIENDKNIRLINSHTNSFEIFYNFKTNFDKNLIREKQIIELEELTLSKDISSYIIAGDLNTIKEFNEIDYKKYELENSIEEITFDSNNSLTKQYNIKPDDSNINYQVDYILYKNLELKNSKIVFKENIASDHYGIKSVFKI